MNSKRCSSPRAARRLHAITLACSVASSLLACSVYDESLRQGSGLASTGGDSAAAGSDAGGAGPSSSGGSDAMGGDLIDAGAPGNGGDSGEPSNGGRAGNASGGHAGVASGGSGGLAAAGNAGSPNNGGSAGSGGTGGSAGSATTELALGKATSASTQQPANPSSSGNDGQVATRFSATSATLPQWWRVDLGAVHTLTQISVQFEFADRKYTYAVETSADDATYTTQANVMEGIGTAQLVPIPSVSARYVRITCTSTVPGVDASGTSRPTWMSFWEVSVQGN